MNVSYSNNITNTIRLFRETIYNTDIFKQTFSNNLYKAIDVKDITYIPEQFGGWSVIVSMNDNIDISKFDIYTNLLNNISDVFSMSVHNIDKSISCKELAANLINIIVSGSNSIIIKL